MGLYLYIDVVLFYFLQQLSIHYDRHFSLILFILFILGLSISVSMLELICRLFICMLKLNVFNMIRILN